ncbi:MAG: hypothetical protein ACRD3L_03440 [Terriglobales bacterium]
MPHADSPTPDDIAQQLTSLPLFQRKAATNSYIGLRVRWKAKLAELVEESKEYQRILGTDATHTLRATYGTQGPLIVTAVNIERFPRLKISHYGTPMELFGRITNVSEGGGSMRLADVQIDFEIEGETQHKLPAGTPPSSSTDYRIERDGTLITVLSDRATRRGKGPRPKQGWRVAFKSRYEAAEFVEAGEADGFSFEGKEFL